MLDVEVQLPDLAKMSTCAKHYVGTYYRFSQSAWIRLSTIARISHSPRRQMLRSNSEKFDQVLTVRRSVTVRMGRKTDCFFGFQPQFLHCTDLQ